MGVVATCALPGGMKDENILTIKKMLRKI